MHAALCMASVSIFSKPIPWQVYCVFPKNSLVLTKFTESRIIALKVETPRVIVVAHYVLRIIGSMTFLCNKLAKLTVMCRFYIAYNERQCMWLYWSYVRTYVLSRFASHINLRCFLWIYSTVGLQIYTIQSMIPRYQLLRRYFQRQRYPQFPYFLAQLVGFLALLRQSASLISNPAMRYRLR